MVEFVAITKQHILALAASQTVLCPRKKDVLALKSCPRNKDVLAYMWVT